MTRNIGQAHVGGRLATLAAEVGISIERAYESSGADNIHDLRVAIARLRNALQVLAETRAGKESRRLRHELKWLRRRLGAARDWDVFASHCAVLDTSGGLSPDSDLMRVAAASKCLEGRDQISLTLRSKRCFALLDSVRHLAAAPEHAGKLTASRGLPEQDAAAALLQHKLRRVRTKGHHLNDMDAGDLHRLRARVRILRYSCEFLRPLFRGDANAYIKALAGLQKILGRLNDSFVVHRLARSMAPSSASRHRIKAMTAHHLSEIEALRRHLHRDFSAFRAMPTFWVQDHAGNAPGYLMGS